MNTSIRSKLDRIAERFEEITALLAEPEVQNNQNQYRELGQEYALLEPVVECFGRYKDLEQEIASAREMLSDPEMADLAGEELSDTEQKLQQLEPQLQLLLIPPDPNDDRNIFLEVRAGTGGAEAALFAGDLLRMYLRYAEQMGWQTETISQTPGELGGYKEVISRVSGRNVYSRLKFESGTHRVQRVPETESQGRVHTSACTVAILPEAAEIDNVEISSNDLRIDTFRASGAGGQHVNKPTRPCASPTCRPASWWSARMKDHNIKTRRARCRCCRPGYWRESSRSRPVNRPNPANCRWAAVTGRSGSEPTIFRRTGSPTTASI